MERPGVRRLNSGGVEITLEDQFEQSNVAALRGNEKALIKLLVLRYPELIDHLVDVALDRKLARLTQELAEDPDKFFRDHIGPYQPPLFSDNHKNGTSESPARGRPRGGTNVTPAYFHEQYRNAVDGTPIDMPPMQRPYRKVHLVARMCFSYAAFDKYLKRWGAPPGYAKPGE